MLHDALGTYDETFHHADIDMSVENGTTQGLGINRASAAPEGGDRVDNTVMKASVNSTYVLRSMTLPVLGNVAVQILLRLSQQSRDETLSLLADVQSDYGKHYDLLRSLFSYSRKAFSDAPLLCSDELDISDSEDRETIRMSNLAATAVSIFGANDVPLRDFHDSFFSICIQDDSEYKESLDQLLVTLKTQVFLDALDESAGPHQVSDLLDRIFPDDFDDSLKQRSGDVSLNEDEVHLVALIHERKELIRKHMAEESPRSKPPLNPQCLVFFFCTP